MDIKEIIAKVEAKLGDAAFKAAFSKNPAKALEQLLGIDLPDEQVNAVVKAVKAKLGAEGVETFAKEAQGIIGGLFGKK